MPPRFKKIYIEITSRCNLRCPFCASGSGAGREMSVDEFSHIIREIQPYTGHICLHVLGEPLLHKGFDRILDIAGEAGLLVNLTTNGVLLEQWTTRILHKPALRQINISLHSKGGYHHEAEVRSYVNSMVVLGRSIAASSKVIISFRLWSAGTDDPVISLANQWTLQEIIKAFDTCDLPYPSGKTGIMLAERVYLNTDRMFEWPSLQSTVHSINGFCLGLRDQVAILADGTVVPCCLDHQGVIALGNIFRERFEQILHNERSAALYNGFNNRRAVEELCRKCTYKTRFDLQGALF